MIRDFGRLKVALIVAVSVLFISDSAMTIISVRAASSDMVPQRQLAAQTALVKLLRADVKRARNIQQALPKTKADCESFENSLPPAGTGYAVISSELQDLGQQAGLQIGSLSFHPKDFTAHGIAEISLDASINGDYKSVVRFVNGLQHSKNHYVVDQLSLANDRASSGTQSGIRVNLHLRSYFRATA